MIDLTCKEGDAWLTGGEAWPTEGKAWATEGKAWPTEGEAWPTEGKAWPTEGKVYPMLNDPAALMKSLYTNNAADEMEVIYDLWSDKFKNPDDVTTQDLVNVWKSAFPVLTFKKDPETEHVVICFFGPRRVYLVPVYHY